MSDEFAVTMNFRCKDLGKESTLVLTFDDEAIPGIFRDVFPTAYKCVYSSLFLQHCLKKNFTRVTTFGANGRSTRSALVDLLT